MRPNVSHDVCARNSGAKNFIATMKPKVVKSMSQKIEDRRKFREELFSLNLKSNIMIFNVINLYKVIRHKSCRVAVISSAHNNFII
jgi:hypothetical protein